MERGVFSASGRRRRRAMRRGLRVAAAVAVVAVVVEGGDELGGKYYQLSTLTVFAGEIEGSGCGYAS